MSQKNRQKGKLMLTYIMLSAGKCVPLHIIPLLQRVSLQFIQSWSLHSLMFSVSGAAADYTLVFQIRLSVPTDGNRRVPVWFYRSPLCGTIWSWWYTFTVAVSLFSPLSNVVHCDLDIVTHYGQTLVCRVIKASLCFPLKSADFNGSATCWGITKLREPVSTGPASRFPKSRSWGLKTYSQDWSFRIFFFIRLTCD